ncbi:MAG: hypothetical protein ACKVHO_14590, partial [Verrucomicrobiia bacterium]
GYIRPPKKFPQKNTPIRYSNEDSIDGWSYLGHPLGRPHPRSDVRADSRPLPRDFTKQKSPFREEGAS